MLALKLAGTMVAVCVTGCGEVWRDDLTAKYSLDPVSVDLRASEYAIAGDPHVYCSGTLGSLGDDSEVSGPDCVMTSDWSCSELSDLPWAIHYHSNPGSMMVGEVAVVVVDMIREDSVCSTTPGLSGTCLLLHIHVDP